MFYSKRSNHLFLFEITNCCNVSLSLSWFVWFGFVQICCVQSWPSPLCTYPTRKTVVCPVKCIKQSRKRQNKTKIRPQYSLHGVFKEKLVSDSVFIYLTLPSIFWIFSYLSFTFLLFSSISFVSSSRRQRRRRRRRRRQPKGDCSDLFHRIATPSSSSGLLAGRPAVLRFGAFYIWICFSFLVDSSWNVIAFFLHFWSRPLFLSSSCSSSSSISISSAFYLLISDLRDNSFLVKSLSRCVAVWAERTNSCSDGMWDYWNEKRMEEEQEEGNIPV